MIGIIAGSGYYELQVCFNETTKPLILNMAKQLFRPEPGMESR